MQYKISQEIVEAPRVIAQQLRENQQQLKTLAARIRKFKPKFALTVGRGSSDHACLYGKYLLETELGLPVSSAAPSVITLYHANLNLKDALVIAVSQSGQSPDICEVLAFARKKGALTVALVNQLNSPLKDSAEFVLPLGAGEEQAVAATKSFIASLFALASLVAVTSGNQELLTKCQLLPEVLDDALSHDWLTATAELVNTERALVIGRGFGYAIAAEAALKFKETASIQAEAFSAAEFWHGPIALAKCEVPFLFFSQDDATFAGTVELARQVKTFGGKVLLALFANQSCPLELADGGSMILRLPESLHPCLDPIINIQNFYPLVTQIAIERGFNPDRPEHLKKVTETI